VREALENVTPARRDRAVPYYGQRKLVGPIFDWKTELVTPLELVLSAE
jgi:hypothetical protein